MSGAYLVLGLTCCDASTESGRGGLVELKVTRWKRYGHDRLYVNLPAGTAVGWADLSTGDITVLVDEYRDDVIAVLAHHLRDYPKPVLPQEAPEAEARPMLPPLTPADDLSTNRPGESLRDLLATSGPGLIERVVSRLLGVARSGTRGGRAWQGRGE